MDPRMLQTAKSDAYQGFLSHFDGHRGRLDSHKAGAFFAEQRKREQAGSANIVVHDREYPQPAPHTYIAGPPSPLHYGVPLSDDQDPGVFAVSKALFGGIPAFTHIPLDVRPVFRRRRQGDGYSEWSNAFVTHVDPCECVNPEEIYTPYEVARYRDQEGRIQTTLNFNA